MRGSARSSPASVAGLKTLRGRGACPEIAAERGKETVDLKERLKIAFVIIIMVPIFMMGLSGKLIIEYLGNSVQQTYDVDTDTMQLITNPLRILNRVTREVYNQIKLCAIREPEKLEDLDYIAQLNEELKNKYSYLVLRKAGEIIYAGDEADVQALNNILPEFGNYSTDMDGGIYVGDKDPVLIKQQDFYFSDGSEGSIFIITDVNVLVPQLKNSIIQIIVCMIMIINITAVVLIIWLYRAIIRPLNTLKMATNEMKCGNLNYSISGDPEDEIGQLCQDFEEMRIHMKELIEERLQYEQDSKELISNISHDLKTPLTAIKGYAEGIMDGIADTPEKMDKYVRTIYTKANDMSVLVDELSFFTKIDSNTVPYNFTTVDANDYFTDCIEELSLDMEVKNIDLTFTNEIPSGTRITADAEQLKRVISNIISNSVKYLDKEKGHFEVRLKDAGDKIQIELEDNGAGIAAKDLPYIFDRFYRADASRNSKKGGTGLGLAIAKKIIEEHGGKIWAVSEEGVGTAICFTLPKKESKKTGSEEQPEQLQDKEKKHHIRNVKIKA